MASEDIIIARAGPTLHDCNGNHHTSGCHKSQIRSILFHQFMNDAFALLMP